GHHGSYLPAGPRQRQRDHRQGRRPREDARPDPPRHADQHPDRPRSGGGHDRPGEGTRSRHEGDADARAPVGGQGPAVRRRRSGRPRPRGASPQARQRRERPRLRPAVPGADPDGREAQGAAPAAGEQVPDDDEPARLADRPPAPGQGAGPGHAVPDDAVADEPDQRTGADGAQDPQPGGAGQRHGRTRLDRLRRPVRGTRLRRGDRGGARCPEDGRGDHRRRTQRAQGRRRFHPAGRPFRGPGSGLRPAGRGGQDGRGRGDAPDGDHQSV
ncbi:MAG: hypothetical protein AVDCRST_MAG33-1636, partial [uncultured Thermomicrobiales bacterium]